MNIQEWLTHFEQAYRNYGISFEEQDKQFLFKKHHTDVSNQEKERILYNIEIFTRYFFKKFQTGYSFCPAEKIKNKIGVSIEENYRLYNGPFYNLAKIYWTFRLEVDNFPTDDYYLCMFQILRNVERNIAGIFFPTPGPISMSIKERLKKQEKVLREYAPKVDIERFLSENPILKTDMSKSGCLTALICISLFSLVFIITFIF